MKKFSIFDLEPLYLLKGISKENDIEKYVFKLECLLKEELPEEKIKEFLKIKEILKNLENEGFSEIENAFTEKAKEYMDEMQNKDTSLTADQETSSLVLRYLDTASYFKKTYENYLQLGRFYSSFDKDKAMDNLERAIEMNPDSGEPYLHIGFTKLRSSLEEEDCEKAIKYFEKAIEKGHEDFFVYFYLGASNYILDNLNEANDNFEKAENFMEDGDEKIPSFLNYRAKLRVALGDFTNAAKDIKKSHDLKNNTKSTIGMYI